MSIATSRRVPSRPYDLPGFDEDGFLIEATAWNAELAAALAELDGMGLLTERHWKVIHHARERFLRVGGVPVLRLLCRTTSLSKVDIKELFGSCRQIWRIAGLPNPGEEAKAYFQ